MKFLKNLLRKRKEQKIRKIERKMRKIEKEIKEEDELMGLSQRVSFLAEKVDPQRFYSEGDDLRKLSDRLWLSRRKKLIKKLEWLKYRQKKTRARHSQTGLFFIYNKNSI